MHPCLSSSGGSGGECLRLTLLLSVQSGHRSLLSPQFYQTHAHRGRQTDMRVSENMLYIHKIIGPKVELKKKRKVYLRVVTGFSDVPPQKYGKMKTKKSICNKTKIRIFIYSRPAYLHSGGSDPSRSQLHPLVKRQVDLIEERPKQRGPHPI